jgi:hypothetical protein
VYVHSLLVKGVTCLEVDNSIQHAMHGRGIGMGDGTKLHCCSCSIHTYSMTACIVLCLMQYLCLTAPKLDEPLTRSLRSFPLTPLLSAHSAHSLLSLRSLRSLTPLTHSLHLRSLTHTPLLFSLLMSRSCSPALRS